ncbi:cation-translocating P-type ATPase [Mycetocola miduiensis]|nr:cation-transporting P-type ATPase [Mycetocola miduiensis]
MAREPEKTSSPAGLTSGEAQVRLNQDGPNVPPPAARRSPVAALMRQFTHLLAILLWAAAGLALLSGTPALGVAIVVVIVLNALFAFWQEYRADRAAERLHALLPTVTRVRRDGSLVTIDAADLVRGDRVMLSSGDRIGADMRVEESTAFAVDESMMTGESDAVARAAGDPLSAGTFVVEGHAEALVTATGSHTTLAAISELAQAATRPPSPLARELDRVVRTVATIAVLAGVGLGLTGIVLGLQPTEAFLFGVGVAVALVPEGLLPTVTLALARGAQLMADQNALVRRLDAVETLGATTIICTDKTGTLTQNRMSVVEVWTFHGAVTVTGEGYEPVAQSGGRPAALALLPGISSTAAQCVVGRPISRDGQWVAEGDPLEAAIVCLAMRSGIDIDAIQPESRFPYTADRMMSSAIRRDRVSVIGAPERVFQQCTNTTPECTQAVNAMAARGLRVLAVAGRALTVGTSAQEIETGLELLGLLGLEDPPRPDVHRAIQSCRQAGIRVVMVTGDHPDTARAIAREVGLLLPGGPVLGPDLPRDDRELGAILDHEEGAVVARVAPADKLRIARILKQRGHVVAMTGDGVNDAPALREADVGVAMGASGSDVAREAADLVLLDDHFATIISAIRLGRATFANARRFLTYHLTDNVAELAPFAVWALSGGNFPLAISVLQVLALDIGTDMLPALALGVEPPSRRVMQGKDRSHPLITRPLLVRAFGVLGPVEAAVSLTGFTTVLLLGGWRWGESAQPDLLAMASGTVFATIASAQVANAFACRSETLPAWSHPVFANRALVFAVGVDLALVVCFLGIPVLAELLGGTWPSWIGWIFVLAGGLAILFVDALHKSLRRDKRT